MGYWSKLLMRELVMYFIKLSKLPILYSRTNRQEQFFCGGNSKFISGHELSPKNGYCKRSHALAIKIAIVWFNS